MDSNSSNTNTRPQTDDAVLNKVLDTVTPEIYESLKKAVELGKWDNGLKLTKEQVENSLQIVIAYDARHKDELDRVGYVAPKPHSQCDSEDVKAEDGKWQKLTIKD